MPKPNFKPAISSKNANRLLATLLVILSISFGYFYVNVNHKKTLPDNQTSSPPSAFQPLSDAQPIQLIKPASQPSYRLQLLLKNFKSRLNYTDQAVTKDQLATLLWSAQGTVNNWGGRTTPSVKDTYPLEIIAYLRQIDSLTPGIYQFYSADLSLIPLLTGNDETTFCQAVKKQASLCHAPLIFIYVLNQQLLEASFPTQDYSAIGYLEAGHAAQNVYLAAADLKLGSYTSPIFEPETLKQLLQLPPHLTIVYLQAIGFSKEE